MDDRRDWEAQARSRLERTVAAVTRRLRAIADQIDAETKFNIRSATGRTTDYASYLRVAQAVVHEDGTGVANLNLGDVIDAAADAHNTQQEKIVQAGRAAAIDPGRVLVQACWWSAQDWAEVVVENDRAMDRPDPKPADQQEFQLADIKQLLKDTAQAMGVEVNIDATS